MIQPTNHSWEPEEWLNPSAGEVGVWRYRGPLGTFSCDAVVRAVIIGLIREIEAGNSEIRQYQQEIAALTGKGTHRD